MKDSDFLYTIFSYDYGIIRTNKKWTLSTTWRGVKWKTLDVWYVINFEISTKEEQSIHKMRNIHILSEFSHENRKFSEIHNYLIFLKTILKKIPEWVPNYEIFEIVEKTNISSWEDIKLILSSLKVLDIAWELDIEHKDKIVKKILYFIHRNKIDTILKLSWIDEQIKEKLTEITH
jgi:hypothetical protein